jgi:hypothetical protein
MRMLAVGAVGMLALQVLLIGGGVWALDSVDPILVNPDQKLSHAGVSMVMLCDDEGLTPKGRLSEVLSKMPPDGSWGAWSRGREVRKGCDIWYHHEVFYSPHSIEECWVGCDHDLLERRLRP